MPFEPQDIRALVAEIASPTAKERELAADKVAGWASETLDPQFAAVLSRTLDSMISLEDLETALESLRECPSPGGHPASQTVRRCITSSKGRTSWSTLT
jgi:hypothetical protein